MTTSLADSANAPVVCEILEWDSAFFGHRIARYNRARCLAGDVAAIAVECQANAIDCVYVLVDPGDTESIANLQRGRAYFADIRMTFGTEIDSGATPSCPAEDGPRVRRAGAADGPRLTRIASASHRDTRFYADHHFDSLRCDRLYEVWIENSCRGFADAVFLIEAEDATPFGYVTCHKSAQSGHGHIGLFAVSEGTQGRGFGKALLKSALDWFSANGVTDMTVATQLRNLRAVRFYGRRGLTIRSVGLWFHLWPRDGG